MTTVDVETKLARAIEGSAKSAREGRLIVRNVGFNVTKEDLQQRFADYGEIVEVHLPVSKRTTSEMSDGRRMRIPPHAGYAFVEFDTREQGQNAITGVNETKIGGRRVAVDFAYDSRIYKAAAAKDNKLMPSPVSPAAAKPVTPAKSDEVKEEEVAKEQAPREAVAPKRKVVEAVTPSKPEPVSEISKKQKTSPAAAAVPKVDENLRKLFLLNLPYDANQTDITESLCEFGSISKSDIDLVLLVKDKEGKFTGKAFVIFGSESVAQKILDLEKSSFPESFGDLYKANVAGGNAAPLEGSGCIVNGRRVSILKSLSKEQVEKEKQKKEEENKPKSAKVVNRTHLDLINAGWINESHEEWGSLSAQEQRLRTTANEERKFKLNNANYIINPKRLTIRNIPKQFENGDLKQAIIKAMAIKGSKKAKKAGLIKVAIVKDKTQVPKDPEAAAAAAMAKNVPWSMDAPESDNEDDKNGADSIAMKTKKKSRGFAFADFKTPESALACLKAMNNVMGAFGADIPRRPAVEFAFDDIRKLEIQKNRKPSLPTPKPEVAVAQGKHVKKTAISKPKKLSRGQKQREKRREAKKANEGQ